MRPLTNRFSASFTLCLAASLLQGIVLNVQCGEAELSALQAEIRAMRKAYEGRIADLEAEVKEMRTGAVQQVKSTNQAIDETLGKKTPADKALTDTPNAPNPLAPSGSGGTIARSSTRVSIGGYTEFSYTDRSNRVPQFNQDRTVLEIAATVNERIKLYIEYEQENGGTIEAGRIAGSEFELEQAYVDFAIVPAFNFRAGTTIVPVGRFNLNHEGFVNNFVNRPLVNRFVIPTTWYEEGVSIHGDPLDTKSLGIHYEMGLYNPAVASGANSDTGFREIRNEGDAPAFRGKGAAARVVFEPARNAKWFADNLEIGLSGYVSNYHSASVTAADGRVFPIAHGGLEVESFDITYEKKNFGFRAEADESHTSAGANPERRAQSARGLYAEAFYSWKPCFFKEGPIAKSFKDPRIVFAERFDYVELNPGRNDGLDLKRFTTGVSFRPLSKTVIKLDYQMDFSNSGLTPNQLYDSGKGHRANAILFGVATGF